MSEVSREPDAMEAAAALERAGLVRLCARLTGSPDAAEDLAHETLYEALRGAHKLRDPEGRPRWLAAIARNVCMRWARSRGKELARVPVAHADHDAAAPGVEALPDEGADLEVDLERGELVEILGRALALLPPGTREVLVRRYVHESPHAEIAERLGTTEKAVWARVGRGKLLLRRALETDLREEAVAHGLVVGDDGGWRETRTWCPFCARARLRCRQEREVSRFFLRCPSCGVELSARLPAVRREVKSYGRLLARMQQGAHEMYRLGLEAGQAPCPICAQSMRLRTGPPELGMPGGEYPRQVHARCTACGSLSETTLEGLVLAMPEVRRFWREHPRIRLLPAREVDAEGEPAAVTTFESRSSRARVDVVSARRDWRVLGVYAEGPRPPDGPA